MKATLLTTALLALLTCLSTAAPRVWKNANATRSFSGELVKREANKVTILMTNSGRKVSIAPSNLHADDIKWLIENHPLDGEKKAGGGSNSKESHIKPGAFYDTIAFGDDRPTVIKKLKESKRFHSELNETFFARTGLNGNFKTTKGNEFFGMPASLYYGWDDNDKLKFLSLYGHEMPASKADGKLVPLWQSMIKDINRYFGKPKSAAPQLQYRSLNENDITFTHVWNMDGGGQLLFGAGKQNGKYVIIARFTTEKH